MVREHMATIALDNDLVGIFVEDNENRLWISTPSKNILISPVSFRDIVWIDTVISASLDGIVIHEYLDVGSVSFTAIVFINLLPHHVMNGFPISPIRIIADQFFFTTYQ